MELRAKSAETEIVLIKLRALSILEFKKKIKEPITEISRNGYAGRTAAFQKCVNAMKQLSGITLIIYNYL